MQNETNNAAAGQSVVDRYLPNGQAAAAPAASQNLFSFSTLRAILWHQRYVLIGVTILALVAGLVVTMLATPRYQATAALRVNTNGGQILMGQEVVDPMISANEYQRYLATLEAVIQSRRMAARVVEDLNLSENPEIMGDSILDGRPDGVSEESWRASLEASAIDAVRSGLTVSNPIGTQILEITYESPDPALSAAIANSYASNFFAEDMARAEEANAFALDFLEGQIAEVRQSLQDAEMQVIDYARANRLVGSSLSSGAAVAVSARQQVTETGGTGMAPTLGAQSLANINELYTQARAERIAAESRWRVIENVPAQSVPEVRDNPNIQNMRSQLAQLEAELADLRQRYQDDYPDVRERIAGVESLTQRINSASAEIKSGIRNEYLIARSREQALSAELGSVADETLDEQNRRVQYNLIDRDVAALRDQLAVLLTRYNQVSSASSLRASDATVLDRATVPRSQSSPNLRNNLLIALILGLGLAVGLAVLREALDDRIYTADDIEKLLGLGALGQTPHVPDDEVVEELSHNFSALSEAYSSIRATLDYSLRKQSNQVVQITSSEAGEGKTTSSIALAQKYALTGKKVLLVDLDLRRPALAKRLGAESPKVGSVDVLFSRVSMDEALIASGIENLDILPQAEAPADPVEILSSGLVAEFLAKARARYDVVIVDSPPVMGIADAPLLSRFVDATVMVVEANRSHHGQMRKSVRRLRDMDANIVGVILTKYRSLDAGEGYGYGYNYYSYSKGS